MSNDNNKKDINSQIDDILNEIRQQHGQNAAAQSESTKPADTVQQAEEEEEFVDISSAGYSSAAQPQAAPDGKSEKPDKKEKKKAAKKTENTQPLKS